MKSALLIVCVVCVHVIHTAFGIPLEGVEQLLIASVHTD